MNEEKGEKTSKAILVLAYIQSLLGIVSVFALYNDFFSIRKFMLELNEGQN